MEIVVCGCQTAREKRRVRRVLNTGGIGGTGGTGGTVKQEKQENLIVKDHVLVLYSTFCFESTFFILIVRYFLLQFYVVDYSTSLRLPGTLLVDQTIPGTVPSLLTDFKISNFVTFSYSGSMKDYIEGFFTSYKKKICF